jgi:hypothetical protein
LATIGRAGEGPGEFLGLAGVEEFGGDSLLAWDARTIFVGRLSVFTAEGVFVRTIPLANQRLREVVGVTGDGTVVAEPRPSTPPDWQRPATGEYREPRLYQRFSTSGAALGAFGPVAGQESAAVGPTGRTAVQFGRDTYVAMGKRAIYAGDSGQFEISVHDPATGQVVRTVRRPFEPVPVAAEELSGLRESRRRTNAMMDSIIGDRTPRPLPQPDPYDVPARETHPIFNRIIEDSDENLWVQHRISADSVQTWSVFDREGSWLGEMEFPRRLSVRAIGRDAIAVVTRDELGVQYVRIFRLLK